LRHIRVPIGRPPLVECRTGHVVMLHTSAFVGSGSYLWRFAMICFTVCRASPSSLMMDCGSNQRRLKAIRRSLKGAASQREPSSISRWPGTTLDLIGLAPTRLTTGEPV
jgi:hypothetical protein